MKFDRAEALKMLSECQEETTSIEVEIGKVKDNQQVDHEALIIKEAPVRIIKTITRNYRCRQTEQGLEIVGDISE